MRNGFTLIETLAALAVTALMLGAVMSAQALVLRSATRARAWPAMRCAVNRLLMLNMLAMTPDEANPPPGLLWRVEDVMADDGHNLRCWAIAPVDEPATQLTLWLRRP